MPLSPGFRPSVSHAALGTEFYDEVVPAEFPEHRLRYRNQRWAERAGLGDLTEAEWIAHFGRFEPLAGSYLKALALRYHGHQFRVYNPELGAGAAFCSRRCMTSTTAGCSTSERRAAADNTPWSRTADGRLTLKGGVREILATEMLEALGVDTSKSFSLIETGEALMRGDEPSPTRSSVLVRLSHSHIRIGSFQRLLYLGKHDDIGRLLDYTIRTYMPDVWQDEISVRAVAFLEEVGRRVARTGAAWMLAGFVHGVLNTDNINVTGESFDYGPWRFLPVLDPAFTAAYFDETGLYAYGRQPDTLLWNMTRLAECLLPFAGQAELEAALRSFEPAFHREFNAAMLRRLGLRPAGDTAETDLVRALWKFLIETRAPFERVFFDWYGGVASGARKSGNSLAALYASPAFQPVEASIEAHQTAEDVNLHHPYFTREGPCTMLIEEVEAIWAPIANSDDWSAFNAKLADIRMMAEAYRDSK